MASSTCHTFADLHFCVVLVIHLSTAMHLPVYPQIKTWLTSPHLYFTLCGCRPGDFNVTQLSNTTLSFYCVSHAMVFSALHVDLVRCHQAILWSHKSCFRLSIAAADPSLPLADESLRPPLTVGPLLKSCQVTFGSKPKAAWH